ncbi:MAG: Crp/Fnr family transcriptional regulator [Clostridia bacterium]|nr:Crp/Fnr family transcriptional regulator [Clostridia bacterium]
MAIDLAAFYRDTLGLFREETIADLASATQVRTRSKGYLVLYPGATIDRITFQMSGISRNFVIDSHGNEVIYGFGFTPGTPLLGSQGLGETSRTYVELLTAADILEVPGSVFFSCMQNDLRLTQTYTRFLLQQTQNLFDIHMVLATCTGEERYRWFLDEYAEILDRIPQHMIASYLKLKPQSLSRVKRNINS